ncbi:MAG: hypothetical protein HC799_14395 [Limnothrix sp. RL_2_0]|nr:hypothetical protein [Limnothrix sp. RL_2_0]
MTHSFLLEAGRWTLSGTWIERNQMPISVKGKTIVAWGQNNWFTMVTKLVFPDTDRPEISYQYKGRLDSGERQYTYVLQQSILGRVEGEGWVGPESIIQRYWVLGDRQRRSGFETFYKIDSEQYQYSGGILAGHYLTSTVEGILTQQP